MDEVIFYEVEESPGIATTEYIIESPSMDPFFIGMRVGGVCLIISLGIAVILSYFRKA